MSFTSDRIRSDFKKADDARDAGLTTPADVVRYDDIAYGAYDAQWQLLDVYRPRAAEGETLPVIVSVHGGGWVYGDKERYQFYCMDLARRGFAVVNFSYRLAPEHKFPAQLEDANAVFTWVLANAAQYGFDARHVFAVGDSAGGHLLGLYAALCTNPNYAARYGFRPPEGFAPTAIALNCGLYTVNPVRDPLTRLLMADLLPKKGTKQELELVNVIPHITPDYPPTFLMTATGDHLKPQAPPLAEALAKAEVPFVYRFYGDKDHVLGHVFHCNVRLPEAALCNDEECDFFRRFL